jgi:hypothetical protein
MLVETDQYEWLVQSTDRLDEGMNIGMTFDPDEIHIMRKSIIRRIASQDKDPRQG